MSFGGFLLGVTLFVIGFYAVYKTDWFNRNMGDVGAAFGVYNTPWASWKIIGIVLMVIGFLAATGLFQLFFAYTVGRLFTFGEL